LGELWYTILSILIFLKDFFAVFASLKCLLSGPWLGQHLLEPSWSSQGTLRWKGDWKMARAPAELIVGLAPKVPKVLLMPWQ
jgi:hypothetical protein